MGVLLSKTETIREQRSDNDVVVVKPLILLR